MAKKKARAPVLPLAWRLPNPPAVFVGRGPDVAWLAAAIERAPLSLVTGPGGLGKTALVLQTLHTKLAKQVPRTLHVDVPPGQPAAQVRHEVLRALAQAQGDGDVDWAELQAEPEVAVAVALDMAEAGGFFVVIDDVYQGDTDETNDMLVQIASFARKSRWIATSRHTPRLPQLAGQVLTLEAMSDPELLELSAAWAPQADPASVKRALASSSGSPWLLHQLLVTGASERSLGEGGLLAGLGDDAVALLRALALVEVPLPIALIGLFAPAPSRETLDALERRGLVHHAPTGYRLHDVARGMLLGPAREMMRSAEAAHAAAVLSQQDAPEAQLEAARLLAALDRLEALSALLDRSAERLIAEGYAPRLWKVLREVNDPSVEAWQLRCAAELGNPTALGQVHAPRGQDPGEVLAWARTLHAQGDIEESITRARQVLAEAAVGTATHDEASFLLAACLRHAGRYAESARLLDAVSPRDEPTSLRRDAGTALSRVLAGEAERDLDLRTLRKRALSAEPHIETACEIAEALLCVGHLREAAEVLERARSSPRGARPALLASRQASLLAARIHLRAGDLGAARRLADEVRAFARGSSVLLPVLHTVDVTRRLLAGELEGLEPLLATCRSEVEGIDAARDLELASLGLRLAILRGTDPSTPLAIPAEMTSTRPAREATLWHSLHQSVSKGTRPKETLAAAEADPAEVVVDRMAHAASALAEGDAARATAHVEDAVRHCGRWGMRSLEAEARDLACDALLCAGRTADLAAAANELASLAEALPSPRFARKAQYHAMASGSRRLSPAVIEQLAAAEHTAPQVARRAQAALGGDPPLDHIDLRVLEALAGRMPTFDAIGAPPTSRAEGRDAPWREGWGLDEVTGHVWLSGGRVVDLSARGLPWKILEALASRGGEATKEELVRDAWGEPDYHPLRHDGRLHVAIRKLRELIEDSDAAPARLVTSEQGYKLSGNPRRAT